MGGGGWGLRGLAGICDEVNGGRGLAIEIVNAACVTKAVHLEIREEVAAWRKSAGMSRVLVRARVVMKEAVSSPQRPPTSIPKTARRREL